MPIASTVRITITETLLRVSFDIFKLVPNFWFIRPQAKTARTNISFQAFETRSKPGSIQSLNGTNTTSLNDTNSSTITQKYARYRVKRIPMQHAYTAKMAIVKRTLTEISRIYFRHSSHESRRISLTRSSRGVAAPNAWHRCLVVCL